MKSPFLFLCLLFLALSQPLLAQKSHLNLTGKVVDTENQALKGATVVVLQAADSIMVSFALTDKTGGFTFRRLKAGNYLLQITFIGYKKISQDLIIDTIEEDLKDLGTFVLESQALSMEEVKIEAEQTPILIKKDTVEYNAGSFKVQPNSPVEDLLRKLPGVEVERDGTVKAQGENVEKILVDGKEFFGEDPTIATKNLPADAVDKVQVFDKKSEMAEFSGIDDGERNKTINLKLKEGKKQGAFGKVKGGYGTEDRYEGNFNINRFSKKLQFSALGMLNNTNQQGFSFNDYIQFMGGLQNMMTSGGSGGGGSFSINTGGGGLQIGQRQASGFTNTHAGGINFNYDFGKDTEWQSSYFFNQVNNSLDQQTTRQNFLNTGDFFTEEGQVRESRSQNHRLNFSLKHKIDSTQNISVRGNAGLNLGSVDNESQRMTLNAEKIAENQSTRDNTSEGDQYSLTATLMYRKRFQKKGRTFSTGLSVSNRNNDQEAFVNSFNQFFDPDPLLSFVDTIFQSQLQNTETLNYSLRVNYTEPVGKGLFLGLNVLHQNNQYDLQRDVNDLDLRSPNLNPWVRNELLSNFYDSDYQYNQVGTTLRINKKKHSMSIGVNGQQSSLKGTPGNTGVAIQQEYYTLLPKLNWNWDIATAQNLSFNYRTNLREPSLEQLQPITDNSDPLNIYEGNPGLRPEYSHSADLQFMRYDQFSFTNFMIMFNATYTQFKITNARLVDSLFRQITRPVNVDNDFRAMSYMNFSTPIRPLGIKVGVNGNVNFNRSYLFINEIENLVNRLNSSVGVSLENRNKDIVDISVGARFGHNLTDYSENSNLNRTFLNQTYSATLILTLGKSWSARSNIDYNIYTDDEFGRQNIPLWTASISRYILESNRGQITLSAFDIVKQNVGFSRNSSFNYIEEISTLTLSRYFLLSFTYSLSKLGLKSGRQGAIMLH